MENDKGNQLRSLILSLISYFAIFEVPDLTKIRHFKYAGTTLNLRFNDSTDRGRDSCEKYGQELFLLVFHFLSDSNCLVDRVAVFRG